MATRRGERFTVSISDITHGFSFQNVIAQVKGLTYDAANDLLLAFNNEDTSFAGRYILKEEDTWPELSDYEPIPEELDARARILTP
jgi:hypothetical protein